VREGGGLSRDQLLALYREQDAYVAYAREGWGLPTLEAMACGLEVIACDYGAPMAYLGGGPARLFGAGRLSADNLSFEGGDLAGLRRHLREVFEGRRRTRAWAERFAWRPAVERILGLVRERYLAWRAAPSA
jgi:glycosyltransferase involved in cell wall biosynthesis